MSIQDFKVEQDNHGQFDFVIDTVNKVFDYVGGFETAIDVQSFLNKRTNNQDVANPIKREGWIGDLVFLEEGFEIGSLLWLKNQSRDTPTDRNEMEAYVKDAFNHLILIGAIKEIAVEFINDTMDIIIKISNDEIKRYSKLWRQTNADNA